jgi:hypothetical protein
LWGVALDRQQVFNDLDRNEAAPTPLSKYKYGVVDPNKSTSRQDLAHAYVRCDRAVELCSLPHRRLRHRGAT